MNAFLDMYSYLVHILLEKRKEVIGNMKNRKKMLGLFLTVMLLFSILAACTDGSSANSTGDKADTSSTDGSSAVSDGEVVLNEDGSVKNPEDVKVQEGYQVFWSLFGGGDGEALQQMVDNYNATDPAKPVQVVLCGWSDYYTKLMTAISADQGPDISVSHTSSLTMLVEQGVVQDITALADDAGFDWSDYADVSIEAITYDGQKYAMPLDTHAQVLFYNTDLLTEAGVSLESDGTLNIGSNWDEYCSFLENLKTNLPEGVYPISCSNAGEDPFRMWYAFYYQLGGNNLVNEDGTIGIDQDIAQQAAEYVKYLFDQEYIAPNIESQSAFFVAGSAALYTAGTWTVGMLEAQEGFNAGAQVQAQLFDTEACWADSHTLTVPTGSSDPEAAFDFISYVSKNEGNVWATSGQIPSSVSIKETEEYQALTYQPRYASASEFAVLPSKTSAWNQIKMDVIEQLDLCWAGEQDAAATAEGLVSAISSALS